MKISLLRHAETTSNEKDLGDSQLESGLTDLGKKQSQNLVPTLIKDKYDIIIVSTLKRTVLTLQPFLDTLKKPNIIESKLTVERDLGKYQGLPAGIFQKYCDDHGLDKVFTKPENGESIAETYERAKKFLFSIKETHKGKNILISGHKNFLLCLEIAITNKDIKDFYLFEPFKNGEIRRFYLE